MASLSSSSFAPRAVEPDEVKEDREADTTTAPVAVVPGDESGAAKPPNTVGLLSLPEKKTKGGHKTTPPTGTTGQPLSRGRHASIDGTFFAHWINELIATETTLLQTLWIIQHVIRPAVLERMAGRTDWTGQVRARRAAAYFDNVSFLVGIHQEILRRLVKNQQQSQQSRRPTLILPPYVCVLATMTTTTIPLGLDLTQVAARREHPTDTVDGREKALRACLELLEQVSGFFTAYRDYVVNFQGASEVFSMILGRRTNSDFVKFLDARCKDLSFAALTMEPVQRLMRYQLFFEAVAKAMPDDDDDDDDETVILSNGENRKEEPPRDDSAQQNKRGSGQKALVEQTVASIRRVVQIVNNASEQVELQARVYEIFKELDHEHGAVKDLVHPARRYVDAVSCRVEYLDKKSSPRKEVELVLLTDTVLVTVKCTSLARAKTGKRRRAKFRLSILEIELAEKDDDGILVQCDQDDACDCTHAHVRVPPTAVAFPIVVRFFKTGVSGGTTTSAQPTRDRYLRKLLDMQQDNLTRRNSFWNTPRPAVGDGKRNQRAFADDDDKDDDNKGPSKGGPLSCIEEPTSEEEDDDDEDDDDDEEEDADHRD